MSTFSGVGITLVVLGLLLLWRFKFRHFHTGFGVILRRRESDGTVWVCSRLLGYPAHRAGIEGRTRVVSIDGHPMLFWSTEELAAWVRTHAPVRGKEETWVVQSGAQRSTVCMKPVLVTTSIPDEWNPNQKASPAMQIRPDYRFRRGLAVCTKTGMMRVTYRLTDEAMRGAYFH